MRGGEAFSIPAIAEQESHNASDDDRKSYRAPSVLMNVIIGCLAHVTCCLANALLQVLQLVSHFSRIHSSCSIIAFGELSQWGSYPNLTSKLHAHQLSL